MNQLEELEKSKEILERELGKVNEQIYQAKLKQHGLSIGGIVDHGGLDIKVISAEFWNKGKPWIVGSKKNKAGEWSTREYQLFDRWELK